MRDVQVRDDGVCLSTYLICHIIRHVSCNIQLDVKGKNNKLWHMLSYHL